MVNNSILSYLLLGNYHLQFGLPQFSLLQCSVTATYGINIQLNVYITNIPKLDLSEMKYQIDRNFCSLDGVSSTNHQFNMRFR